MKLFKLSLKNIRRSMRDYSIYFFTLIIGVAVFYIFNAVATQAAMLRIQGSQEEMVEVLDQIISILSVFIAFVLGFLIVYASRFLVKRRWREFALYMTLGMGKGQIGRILAAETVCIGILSLAVGLLLGIGLSQLMSVIIAQMFEADLTGFTFVFSAGAFIKTIVCFAVIMAVVAVFDLVMIGKAKLIDLMNTGSRAEKIRMKHPVVCIVIFVISAALLGWDYYTVSRRFMAFVREGDATARLVLIFLVGAVCTFFIFWSVSGLLLGIISRRKGRYLKGLNSFTYRQLSSRINTMVMSLTVICLLLFFTICILSSALSMRTSLNQALRELVPVDIQIGKVTLTPETRILRNGDWGVYDEETGQMQMFEAEGEILDSLTVAQALERGGFDLAEYFKEYVEASIYRTQEFTLKDALGDDVSGQYSAPNGFLSDPTNQKEDILTISDYNAVARLYGREEYSLADGEYLVICNYEPMFLFRNAALKEGVRITVFGHELSPKFPEVQDGFLELSGQAMNTGIIVVPDNAVDPEYAEKSFLMGNYHGEDENSRLLLEREQ